jgi:hypothetical protein
MGSKPPISDGEAARIWTVKVRYNWRAYRGRIMANTDMPDPTPPTTGQPEANGYPTPTVDPGETVEALRQRIKELETALEKMTRQREETRRMFFELYEEMFPDDPPPTEEELLEERKSLTTKTISEFLAELEQEAGANGA